MTSQYVALLVFAVFGLLFGCGVFTLSKLFRERGTDPLRSKVYECGMDVIGTPYVSPNIRFYIFALVFVIFDVESVFLLPWAVRFKQLGTTGFVEMVIFLLVLSAAFAYVWRKGALKWE